MDWKLVLQIVGFALGMLYMYLEYKADVRLWIVGLIMPMIHGTLYFKAGLYADFGMEMYYIAAGIWGLVAWKVTGKRKTADNGIAISSTPLRLWPLLIAIYAVLHAALYFFLSLCTDSTVPFWDAMTTAMSIVAMWMLARKYKEQWLVWVVRDLITVGLYIYKDIPITALRHVMYAVIGVAGYMKWRKMLKS